MRQPPSEEENEVWGYIIKCRQLLAWQLSEVENSDLREIVYPALAKRRSYDRHETLNGVLRDKEYEDQLRQVMHIYHTVVMEVCDWMIYNKEYFHLLIGNYTTFEAFANAIDAAIVDECRGTQSRVWTRKGIVELDEPIEVGTPHSSHLDDDSDSESDTGSPASTTETPAGPPSGIPLHVHNGLHAPRATPTTASNPVNVPPKAVLTPALAVLTHLPPRATTPVHHGKHHVVKPRALHTPPHTPPEEAKGSAPSPALQAGKPDPNSVLFKPEQDVVEIKPVVNVPRAEDNVNVSQMQSIDILEDEAYKPSIGLVTPQPRPASVCSGSPRPLVPPLSRRPTIVAPVSDHEHEPRQLAAPTPRRATIAYPSVDPHPLSGPRPSTAGPLLPRPSIAGPSSPRRGSTWELSLVGHYGRSPSPLPLPAREHEDSSPVEHQGPTFPISTPFYTPSHAPSPAPEPPSPPPPLGPTFELPTPFYVKPRRDTVVAPPSPGPASPIELVGPTFDIPTPFFVKPRRPTIVAPAVASPTMPDGPTFPISTPFFTYASRSRQPQRALSPEPSLGPVFPVRTPLFTYSHRALPEPEPASPDEPMGPTFPINTPLFTYAASTLPAHRKKTPVRDISPEPPLGPTFPVRTPLFTYSNRPLPEPEPASPDEPMGPTFPVNTPLFTYAPRTIPANKRAKSPEPVSPDMGPTYPINTPLWSPPFNPNYACVPPPPVCVSPPPEHRPVMITVPGLKIIAPSIASSKLDAFPPSSNSEVFAVSEVSPKSATIASTESASSSKSDLVIITPEGSAPELKDESDKDSFRDVPIDSPASPTLSELSPIKEPVVLQPESPKGDVAADESHDSAKSVRSLSLDTGSTSGADAENVTVDSVTYAQSPEHPDETLDTFPNYDSPSGSGSASDHVVSPHAANDTSLPTSPSADSLSGASPLAAVPTPPASASICGPAPGPSSPRRNESSTTIRTVSDGASPSPKRSGKVLAKRPSLWDRDIDSTPSHPAHVPTASTSSAPAHSSAHVTPHPSPPARIRPMSSNGSLQHQWIELLTGASDDDDLELGLESGADAAYDFTFASTSDSDTAGVSDQVSDDNDYESENLIPAEQQDDLDLDFDLSEDEDGNEDELTPLILSHPHRPPTPTSDVPYTRPYSPTVPSTIPSAPSHCVDVSQSSHPYATNMNTNMNTNTPTTSTLITTPPSSPVYTTTHERTYAMHDPVHGAFPDDTHAHTSYPPSNPELPLPVTTPKTAPRALPLQPMPGAMPATTTTTSASGALALMSMSMSLSPAEVWRQQKAAGRGALSALVFLVLWFCMLYW